MSSKYFIEADKRIKDSKKKKTRDFLKEIINAYKGKDIDGWASFDWLKQLLDNGKIDKSIFNDVLLQLKMGEVTKTELILIRNYYKKTNPKLSRTITAVIDYVSRGGDI